MPVGNTHFKKAYRVSIGFNNFCNHNLSYINSEMLENQQAMKVLKTHWYRMTLTERKEYMGPGRSWMFKRPLLWKLKN